MKHKLSNNVICPFYLCEERQVVYCEGVEDGTSIHLGFNRPPALKEYKKQFCETQYCKCRIAQMLNKKWEERC